MPVTERTASRVLSAATGAAGGEPDAQNENSTWHLAAFVCRLSAISLAGSIW
jgi:hypothetical protein